jgi:hypothetical protein
VEGATATIKDVVGVDDLTGWGADRPGTKVGTRFGVGVGVTGVEVADGSGVTVGGNVGSGARGSSGASNTL